MQKRKLLALASSLLLALCLSACESGDTIGSIDNPPIDLDSIESSSSEDSSVDSSSGEIGSSSEDNSSSEISSVPTYTREFSMNYSDGNKQITPDDFSGTYRIEDNQEISLQHCNFYQFIFELPVNETIDNTNRSDSVKVIDHDKMLDLKPQNALTKDLAIFLMTPMKIDDEVHEITVEYHKSSQSDEVEMHKFTYKVVDYNFEVNNVKTPTLETLNKFPTFNSMIQDMKKHTYPGVTYEGIPNAETLYQPETLEGVFEYNFEKRDDKNIKTLAYDLGYEKHIPDNCYIPSNIEFPVNNEFSYAAVEIAFNKPSDVRAHKPTPSTMNALTIYYLSFDPSDIIKENHVGTISLFTITPKDYKGVSTIRGDVVYSMLHNEYYLASQHYADKFLTVKSGNNDIKICEIGGSIFGTFDDEKYSYQMASVAVNSTKVELI